MALYQYQCPACNKTLEVVRPMSAAGEPVLCECGQQATQKFSHFNFSMGPRKAKSTNDLPTLGDFPDTNEWIDA